MQPSPADPPPGPKECAALAHSVMERLNVMIVGMNPLARVVMECVLLRHPLQLEDELVITDNLVSDVEAPLPPSMLTHLQKINVSDVAAQGYALLQPVPDLPQHFTLFWPGVLLYKVLKVAS